MITTLDDIMGGQRQPRGPRMLLNEQNVNTGVPSLNEKELKTEEEKNQAPGSPLGVRANKAREELIGPTGNAGTSAAASRSSLRVSTPVPIAPSGVKATGISSQPSLSVNMSGDTESANRKLKETVQHIKTPVEMANYGDILRYYKQPKTDAELEEEERKQKRNETLARLGDGIGAFHDAYSYARGVKPLERSNMTEKSRKRYEKMRAEWNQDRDSYVNAVLRQAQERRADANAEANAQYRRDTIEIRRQKEQNQQEMNSARLKYWDAKSKGETEKAEYYSKLYELVANGMTEKDARVALGIEPKTTYTVTDKHDSSGKKATGGNKKPKGNHAKKTYSSVSALGIGG